MDELGVIDVAKRFARQHQLPWDEPVHTAFDAATAKWRLCTNADSRGSNLQMVIDDRTTEVEDYKFLPR